MCSGGRDYGSPLQIQSVNPNSLSEQSGMQSNDYILRIGQISTEFLQHKEAQEQIKRQNNFLDLTLQRFVRNNDFFNFNYYFSVVRHQQVLIIIIKSISQLIHQHSYLNLLLK